MLHEYVRQNALQNYYVQQNNEKGGTRFLSFSAVQALAVLSITIIEIHHTHTSSFARCSVRRFRPGLVVPVDTRSWSLEHLGPPCSFLEQLSHIYHSCQLYWYLCNNRRSSAQQRVGSSNREQGVHTEQLLHMDLIR